MKLVYKIFAPFFVLVLLAVGAVGVAFARVDDNFSNGLNELEIAGTVEAIDGSSWTVDGQVYQVTASTEIKGLIQPGALVKLHVYTAANGALTIREVELAGVDDLFEDDSDDRSGMDDDDMDDDDSVTGSDDSDRDGSDDSGWDDDNGDDNSGDDGDDSSDSSGHDNQDDDSDDDDDNDDHGDNDDGDDDNGDRDDDHGDDDDRSDD